MTVNRSPEDVIREVEAMLDAFEPDAQLPDHFDDKGDALDPIRQRLNAIAERSRTALRLSVDYQRRVEELLQVLLRYALFDFSVKAEVGEAGDEIDAIALGLNTVAEELQSARETERRQLDIISEKNEQVEVILANAPSAVVVIDTGDRVMRWNKRAEQMFGYTASEATGKRLSELIIPARLRTEHHRGMAHYLQTGEGPILNTLIEVTACRKGGSEFPVELGISTVRSTGQELFIGFMNDISSRRIAEEKLRRTNLQLENSNRELESFSYSVSHDLRAPLRAINGYTQILMKEYTEGLDSRGKQMMESVLSNVKRMGSLIDDLLSLSRFGRAELKKQRVDMNRLVNNVVSEARKHGNISHVEINVDRLPPAMADATLIAQVVTNLLSNAIKYSSKTKHPKVDIGVQEQQGSKIYFIRDNGTGFDMKFYDKLFGVFQRLHDSTEYEGTGVGLAIVKRIIDRHDGRVWADSEPGHGATFYFTLDNGHMA